MALAVSCTVIRDLLKAQGIRVSPGMKQAWKWAEMQAEILGPGNLPRTPDLWLPVHPSPCNWAQMSYTDEDPHPVKKAVDGDVRLLIEMLNIGNMPRVGALSLKTVKRWYLSLPHFAVFMARPFAPVAIELIMDKQPYFLVYYGAG
ncbi:hypothetical protein GGF31_008434 [Allomyces arbusculus]|nr:hypothetical protein GGF31_008434 [Allomyces arbusculus]